MISSSRGRSIRGRGVGVSARGVGRGGGRGRGISNATEDQASNRGRNYTNIETNIMLDIVGDILPHGQEMWLRVQEKYNADIPSDQGFPARDSDSLKNKFKQLRNMSKPTGDPDCPPTVIRAKRISRDIENEMAVTNLGEDEEHMDYPRIQNENVPSWIGGAIEDPYSSDENEHEQMESTEVGLGLELLETPSSSSSEIYTSTSPQPRNFSSITINRQNISTPTGIIRTGLIESELSNVRANNSNSCTRKRQKLDVQIEQQLKCQADTTNFMQVYILENQRLENI
jgi:hypothetical protein